MNLLEYPYANGPLLDQRNTYFYSHYQGRSFLDAWKRQRDLALKKLPEPSPALNVDSPCESNVSASTQKFDTGLLLNNLIQKVATGQIKYGDGPWRLIDKLTQRFEVTKRIHDAYNENWRACDKGAYKTYELYIRFAELMEMSYKKSEMVQYLNALLKCIDTLCAIADNFDETLKSQLARLIVEEQKLVKTIAKKVHSPL